MNGRTLLALPVLMFVLLACNPHVPPPGPVVVPGCPQPPPDVFAKTGIDSEFAQSTFGKVIVGTIKVKTQPDVVTLLSQAASDSRVRDYLRCLAIKRDHYTNEQAAYLEAMNAYLASKPTAAEFGQWQEKHVFPSSSAPSTAPQQDLPSLPSAGTPCVQQSPSQTVVDFRSVDTATAPGLMVAAAPYLKRCRISIDNLQPAGSELVIVNNLALYGGQAIQPSHSQNFLMQVRTNNTEASFVLRFSEPLRSVSFKRPALYSYSASGITYPAWRAFGLSASGDQLAFAGEAMFRKGSDALMPPEARIYTLTAPGFEGIAAVRFEADPRLGGVAFAAFPSVIVDQLIIARE